MIARYLKLAIVFIIVASLAAYVLLVIIRQSYDTAKAIGKDFNDAFKFTPEVKVRNTIVLRQQTPYLSSPH